MAITAAIVCLFVCLRAYVIPCGKHFSKTFLLRAGCVGRLLLLSQDGEAEPVNNYVAAPSYR